MCVYTVCLLSIRFALEEAVKQGQVEVIELILQNGYAPFQELAGNESMLASLSSALINFGHIECVIRLMSGFDLSQYPWNSQWAVKILFVAQAVHDGSDMYESILNSFLIMFCKTIANWESLSSDTQSSVFHSLKLLCQRCFFSKVSEHTRQLQSLINLWKSTCSKFFSKVDPGHFFHYICGQGYFSLASFLLKSCSSSKHLVNKPDANGRSPLFYAACGGHLNVVQLLLEHQSALSPKTGLSPLVGALLYLALAPFNVGGDTLGKSYQKTLLKRTRHLKAFSKILPDCSFSPVCEDIESSNHLLRLLLPPESDNIFMHLSTLQNSSVCKPSHILLLLASSRTCFHIEPLLSRLARESAPSLFKEGMEYIKESDLLDVAITLVPLHTGDKTSKLLESFLLQFMSDTQVCLTAVLSAAEKGYWDIVLSATNSTKHALTFNQGNAKSFFHLCLLAIQAEKSDIVQSLLGVGCSSQFFKAQWWSKFISAAVHRDSLDIVRELIVAGCDPIQGLKSAARYGRIEAFNLLLELCSISLLANHFVVILAVASQSNQQSIIQLLLTLYENQEVSAVYEGFTNKTNAFWFCVLVHATKNGHENLALTAVANISDNQLKSVVSKHEYYHDVLYYSCYWGLSALLQCIPYQDDDLITRKTYDAPLEASIANGKLSYIPACQSVYFMRDLELRLEDSSLIMNDEGLFDVLLTGYFHQLCSIGLATPGGACSIKYTENYSSIFHKALSFGVPNAVEALKRLTRSHCAPILLDVLDKYPLNLLEITARTGNVTLLEQSLRTLHNSDLLLAYCSHSCDQVLKSAIQSGSSECMEILLRSQECFVRQLSATNRAGQNILHTVILAEGHKTEITDLALSWLSDHAPDMCLALDNTGYSPLYLAFALGKYERAAKLLEKAHLSSHWAENVDLDWRAEAKKSHAWMREMNRCVKKEKTGLILTHFNIRATKSMKSLFKSAVNCCNNRLVQDLLRTSCGLVLENSDLLKYGLFNQNVLEYLQSLPSYVSLVHLDATDIACKFLCKRSCVHEVKFLLDLLNRKQLPISLNQNKVFLAACATPSLTLVQYFVKHSAIPVSTLKIGIVDALNIGAYEIAAAIVLAYDVTNPVTFTDISWASLVVKAIFVFEKDYQTIVEDFFGSLARVEATRCLPFSELWLTHNWGLYQSQLLTKKLGDMCQSPSNPWLLGIQWRNNPVVVSTEIDWKSFTECILDVETQTDCLPLKVEAIVFSSTVLGQLYLKEDGDHIDLAHLFEDLEEPLSSLVVAAVKWPHLPSAGLVAANIGLLTLSYKSEDRVFVFPACYKTEVPKVRLEQTSASDNKAAKVRALFLERLAGVSKYYKTQIRCLHKTSVSIAFDGCSGVTDYPTFSVVNSAISDSLEYCCHALKLAILPTVAYASILQWKDSPLHIAPPKKKLFSHISITISLAEREKATSAVVSLVDSAIDYSVTLYTDTTMSPPCCVLPDFDSLLQQTVTHVLTREVDMYKERFVQLVAMNIIPKIQKLLRTNIEKDKVEVIFEDLSGTSTKLVDVTFNHILLLKAQTSIKRFLHHFYNILLAYSLKPKLLTSIQTYFQHGFRVVISRVSSSAFTVQSSIPELTIFYGDLQFPQNHNTMLSIFSSILQHVPLRDQAVKSIFADVPCPFLSYVDLDRSKDFLYASVGSLGRLVVQIVSYDQQKQRLPLKHTCYLKVVIRSPKSKILRASSSEDPNTHCSKNLYVSISDDGLFEVCWTPQEQGVHSLSLSMNGVPIQDSFTRVFVSHEPTTASGLKEDTWYYSKGSNGERQVAAGTPITFITEHVGPKCFCTWSSSIVLTNRKSIKPSPYLKDLPGYKTFTPILPSTVTSTAQVSNTNTITNLKELILTLPKADSSPQIHSQQYTPLPLLHHLSVTAAYGGSKEWLHISPTATPAIQAVTVHVTTDEGKDKKQWKSLAMRPKVHCISMGRNMYRVSLLCSHAAVYKVFASCPTCQSVMKIHWFDEQTFFPQPCYILPGPFSADKSTISKQNCAHTLAYSKKHHHTGI